MEAADMFLVCPFCADADDVDRSRLGPGAWHYRCSNAANHPAGSAFEWDATEVAPVAPGFGGLAEELGLPQDLLACLEPGEPWVEYGVIEHRFSTMRPENFQRLVDTYGHTRLESKHYTASVYIALTLGRLLKTDAVCWRQGRGTGYWKYNSDISYWALPPAPPGDVVTTYMQYATAHGIDPMA